MDASHSASIWIINIRYNTWIPYLSLIIKTCSNPKYGSFTSIIHPAKWNQVFWRRETKKFGDAAGKAKQSINNL